MKRTLAYLALLVAAALLAACGSPLSQPPLSEVPRPEFQPVQTVEPAFNPFTGEAAAPQAEFPTVWFVELDQPAGVDIGLQAASLSVSNALATLQAEAARQGVSFEPRYTFSTFISGFSAALEPHELLTVASLPGVKRVMPVGIVEAPEVTRHDPSELTPQLTTALSMTGADFVQSELGFTGAGVRVGIIDTGIMLTHPEFSGRITAGFDFVGDFYNAGDPANNVPVPEPGSGTRPGGGDCNGHGTHVAGIVGAGGVELTGVAPEVELGAYRVFGCTGSSHSDVILAAIERAFADGMDVVNLSLGSNNGWAQDFLSVALSRMLDFGMIPVASAGNNGASGVYTVGAPGSGDNVITVASFDNIAFESNIFEVADRTIGYSTMAGSVTAPTAGSEEIVFIGRACNVDTLEADPNGKVALVVRGACTFAEKALNAEAAGATAVVIHNNVPGNFAGTLGGAPVDVPVVSISQEDGLFIRDQAPPVTLTWLEGTESFPNPTGNLISTFSSYGLTPELTLKPDIGAPGGLIKAPYIENAVPGDPDSGDATYAVLSGTSMSAPHVAGAVALMLQARPDVAPNRVRDLMMNVAEPQLWNLNPDLGFALDSVHRQGAGMLRIDNAILNRTYAVPAKLSLGESAQGSYVDVITLHNETSEDVTYTLTQIEASGLLPIATTGNSNNPGFAAAPPLVEYFKLRQSTIFEPIDEITVPAGSTASFRVRVTANPNLPDGAVYGTYLAFLPQSAVEGASTILVPAAGFKGDYQQLPVFTLPPFLAFVDEAGNVFIRPEGWVFTMRGGDVPTFGFGLAHAVQRATAQFIPLGERSWMGAQPAFEAELVRRNNPGSVYVFGLGDFDASFLPDGEYKIRLEMLKALGDPTNPNHVVTVETPRFVIDRSAE
jgi:minor extracellular serine protease Vpr